MAEIKKICASTLNRKIIRFFQENPSTVDTSRGIAAWLNFDRKEVKKALDSLVKEKILIPHRIGSSIAYAYTQDKKIIKKIEQSVKSDI
ncbi:MAG: hypothetical protein JW869_05370 [Candidatus Omnitrophica bacterium]|nr:hypothetical protein [Candidatus Omnitrophota bacterium]